MGTKAFFKPSKNVFPVGSNRYMAERTKHASDHVEAYVFDAYTIDAYTIDALKLFYVRLGIRNIYVDKSEFLAGTITPICWS